MRVLSVVTLLMALLLSAPGQAEQKKQLGDWDVHYMVVNTTFLSPDVARAYGITRSRYSALVNISVLDKGTQKAQDVQLQGNARNMIGNNKTLEFKQVKDGEAIYYLAVMSFRNDERYRFNIDVFGKGGQQQTLKFEQKMYVD